MITIKSHPRWLFPAVAAAVAVMCLLVVANVWTLQEQADAAAETRREIIEAQVAINNEQHQRLRSVCDALTTSNRNLARAMEALIQVSDADSDVVEEFTRLAGLTELANPPPQCAKVNQPLPRPLGAP